MGEHPSSRALESFLLGRLSAPEARDVVCHLLSGCARCRDLMAPLARTMFRPGRAGSATTSAEQNAITNAPFRPPSAVLGGSPALVHERAEAASKVRSASLWGVPPTSRISGLMALCEALLERASGPTASGSKGHGPSRQTSAEAAQRLDPQKYGPGMPLRTSGPSLGGVGQCVSGCRPILLADDRDPTRSRASSRNGSRAHRCCVPGFAELAASLLLRSASVPSCLPAARSGF